MSAANGNSLLLQYQRKPQAQPRPQQAQQAPERIAVATPPPSQGDFYDVVWQTGALGLRFTPGLDDEPVVCEITPKASDSIKRSRISIGDVVIAVQVHKIGGPMTAIASLQELVDVFQHEELPITVRFRSRAQEHPEAIALVDITRSYTYSWPPGQPLGVSLAMDPCTLHTTIMSIDMDRIAPEFLPLEPAPGDVLISIRDPEKKIDLDQVRFDKVVDTLRSFPRPCKLTFARLHEDVEPPSTPPPSNAQQSPHVRDPSSPAHAQQAVPFPQSPARGQRPPMSFPSSPAHGQHGPTPAAAPRRPAPLMKRQSFAVGEMKKVEPLTEEERKRKAKHDARFYKVIYSGGHIGLVLHDAKLELKGKPKKNGYYAFIKKVPKHSNVEGLDQASEGDELIAIGQRDLQHVPFEEVQRHLSSISSPTPLVFQRKSLGHAPSIGASLVDGLFLLLI